jgi:hypothetical protein
MLLFSATWRAPFSLAKFRKGPRWSSNVVAFEKIIGEAANWRLIADTLFKAAFDALDRSPDDDGRAALLRRVNTGSYDRLTTDPDVGKPQAVTGQNETVHTDLQSSGPGAVDAFRNSVRAMFLNTDYHLVFQNLNREPLRSRVSVFSKSHSR